MCASPPALHPPAKLSATPPHRPASPPLGATDGKLCRDYDAQHGCAAKCDGDGAEADAPVAASPAEAAEGALRPSGDAPGGFVVYKQTTELVKMLSKPAPSVLD